MEEIFLLIARYKARIIGVFLGIVVGWMIVRYGWLSALFWIICIAVGYVAGTSIDTKKRWREVIEKIFPDHS